MLRAGLGLAAALFLALTAPLALATGAQAADNPEGVRVEMTDEMGPVFADPRGLTLYTWGGDRTAGKSLCTSTRHTNARGAGSVTYDLPEPHKRAACAETWPPFLAKAGAEPVGDWSTVTRDDGALQWAYKGKPLYTFAHDARPGEINGSDGTAGRVLSFRTPLWAPMDSPRGLLAVNTVAGRVLMTEQGKVLYTRKGGIQKVSNCVGDCLTAWQPLPAPAIGRSPKDWSVVELGDGRRQWAYRGRPLFTFAGDSRYADLNGADQPGWEPITLQKPLAPPEDITVQVTSDGEVYADRNGMTLYGWGCGDEGPDRALCDIPGATQTYRLSICGAPETCMKTWRPVIAPKNAKPVGRTWSIVSVDPTGAEQYAQPGQKDALRVWAYRGRPLYTFAGDKEPGDINGHTMTSGFIWGYGVVRADGGLRRAF